MVSRTTSANNSAQRCVEKCASTVRRPPAPSFILSSALSTSESRLAIQFSAVVASNPFSPWRTTSQFAPTAEQLEKVHLWSDQFAKEVVELHWTEELTRKCLALLAGTSEAFRDKKIPVPLQARRAEGLVLALDRLVTGLGSAAADPSLSRALDRLFDDTQSLPDFDPNRFADNLKEFHKGVSPFLDSR